MAETSTDARSGFWAALAARPRLWMAAGVGLVAGLVCRYLAGFYPSTSGIVGWDAFCATYIGSIMLLMATEGAPAKIRARAAADDEGRAVILALVLTAAVASIAAVALELSLAKDAHGLERGVRVALAFATVAASWFLAHLIFAIHYAHGFYDREDEGCGDTGGLAFPGDEPPDYWDFLHFSLVIGVASQTADICITSKRLRRQGTVHSLFSFAFNTVIVALTINLLAGLFS